MNERQLFDAIGRVDDDLILAADRPAVRRGPPRRPRRRHLAQAQLRRPDRVRGGARRRLAPGQARRFRFGGDRQAVRLQTVEMALQALLSLMEA